MRMTFEVIKWGGLIHPDKLLFAHRRQFSFIGESASTFHESKDTLHGEVSNTFLKANAAYVSQHKLERLQSRLTGGSRVGETTDGFGTAAITPSAGFASQDEASLEAAPPTTQGVTLPYAQPICKIDLDHFALQYCTHCGQQLTTPCPFTAIPSKQLHSTPNSSLTKLRGCCTVVAAASDGTCTLDTIFRLHRVYASLDRHRMP